MIEFNIWKDWIGNLLVTKFGWIKIDNFGGTVLSSVDHILAFEIQPYLDTVNEPQLILSLFLLGCLLTPFDVLINYICVRLS